MKRFFFWLIMFICLTNLRSQDLPAYKIYDIDNKEVKFYDMINYLKTSDVVLFGERHDNPIAHWLELEMIIALEKRTDKRLVLGAEMFEADNQLILDEYMTGIIKTKHFEENMRMWNNYETDYKPLVEFACENKIRFIASNIPRRYASIVARNGFEGLSALSDEAKRYIAPLPIEFDPELGCYAEMPKITGFPQAMKDGSIMHAQAIKDATMGYFISRNLTEENIFIHFNGRYHSDNKEGIVWYLNKYAPGKQIITISTTSSEYMQVSEDELNTADFIIVVDPDITRTYK